MYFSGCSFQTIVKKGPKRLKSKAKKPSLAERSYVFKAESSFLGRKSYRGRYVVVPQHRVPLNICSFEELTILKQ